MVERASYDSLGDHSQLHSPPASLSPPFPSEYELHQRDSPWRRFKRWWQQNVKLPRLLGQEQQEVSTPPSGYLTLIPLSDSRLQPRSTRFSALFLLAFALAVAGSVFLLVPRWVSVGEVSVHADRMSWNVTKSTYQLKLRVHIPCYNPNFFRAWIGGDLQVLFYSTEAGRLKIKPMSLPARASPQDMFLEVDASDVPADYILSILTQCSTFPEVLIFFLKGKLSAQYFMQHQLLSTIDTYFLIDCKKNTQVGEGVEPGSSFPALEGNSTGPRQGLTADRLALNGSATLSSVVAAAKQQGEAQALLPTLPPV